MRRIILIAVALTLTTTAIADQPADAFKRERNPNTGAAKDGLENKAPPALQVKGWLNTDGGKPLNLKDLKGKVVVLDFWGVWCPPCRAAMPHLKELYTKHKADGLVVIGVHTTNQGEKMADFAKTEGLTWPLAVDVDQKTVKAFHVDSFPDYYIIDRAGNLRVADLANGELDKAVEALLKEPAPK